MHREPIKISTLAFDRRSDKVFDSAFRGQSQIRCTLVSKERPHVALINADAAGAHHVLSRFQHCYPGVPTISLADSRSALTTDLFLPKPVSLVAMLNSIQALAISPDLQNATAQRDSGVAHLSGARAKRALDCELSKSHTALGHDCDEDVRLSRGVSPLADELEFEPDNFFWGKLKDLVSKARRTHNYLVLSCLRNRKIVFVPGCEHILTDLSDAKLRNLSIISSAGGLDSACKAAFFSINRERARLLKKKPYRMFQYNDFMWNLGFLTSRGRFPAGTKFSERYYLRHWPNCTRVVKTPESMRVIAYWVKHPSSIMQVTEDVNVELADVAKVFCAAYASGIAGFARRESDAIFRTVLSWESRQHVFEALLHKMLRTTSNAQR